MKERFPTLAKEVSDKDECTIALHSYERLLSNKDICEGDCVRGQNCPTGGAIETLDFIFVSLFCSRFPPKNLWCKHAPNWV